jgi:tetratricopeptide (TPR) repeat protein
MADRPEHALRELATLSPAEAMHPGAFHLRAAALSQLDRHDDAAVAARGGLAAGGPDADLLHLLGDAERHLGNLELAERALLDGLALDPMDVGLLCSYATLCLQVGQLDKAAKLIDRAAEQAPGSAAVYGARIQLAYSRGDDREAQEIARQFVAEYPENAAAHALLGGMSALRGQVKQADSGARQAVAADPKMFEYAEMALETKIATHPLLIPVRPFIRFGPIKTWIVAVAIIYGFRMLKLPMLSLAFGGIWLLLCAYSWIVPPLVRRWVTRRWR